MGSYLVYQTLNIIFSVDDTHEPYPTRSPLHSDGCVVIHTRIWWASGLHENSPLLRWSLKFRLFYQWECLKCHGHKPSVTCVKWPLLGAFGKMKVENNRLGRLPNLMWDQIARLHAALCFALEGTGNLESHPL
jgi:hypothetical protein